MIRPPATDKLLHTLRQSIALQERLTVLAHPRTATGPTVARGSTPQCLGHAAIDPDAEREFLSPGVAAEAD
jgi:hypothetical protein